MDLSTWTGVPRPDRITLPGRYARLEPMDAGRHAIDLLQSARQPGTDGRFQYLFEEPPADLATLTTWIDKVAAASDPLFFAVVDQATAVPRAGKP